MRELTINGEDCVVEKERTVTNRSLFPLRVESLPPNCTLLPLAVRTSIRVSRIVLALTFVTRRIDRREMFSFLARWSGRGCACRSRCGGRIQGRCGCFRGTSRRRGSRTRGRSWNWLFDRHRDGSFGEIESTQLGETLQSVLIL